MKIALLIVDMQKCYAEEFSGEQATRDACEHINYVATLLRNAGHHVIHIHDLEMEGEVPADDLLSIDRITVEEADLRVTKHHSNAFWQTELDRIVRDAGFDLLLISGFAAEQCVVFTYNGAVERGYNAAILKDGVVEHKPGRADALYLDRQVVSYGVIGALLGAAPT